MNSSANFSNLIELLNGLGSGKVPPDSYSDILGLLMKCWVDLAGANESSMKARKLDRVEDLEWNPPSLIITIERHGGAALGSGLGDIQRWEIDLENKTAKPSLIGRRQLRPNAPKIDTQKIAKNICDEINGSSTEAFHVGVVRDTGDRVRIKPASFLPKDGPKQTVTSRRKRLTGEIKEEMFAIGWKFSEAKQGWLFFQKISS
jgi:hypothetical protein